MKIKSIVVTINRSQGKPLVYAINPLTVGSVNFAMLRGVACGMIESDSLRRKEEIVELRQQRLRERA